MKLIAESKDEHEYLGKVSEEFLQMFCINLANSLEDFEEPEILSDEKLEELFKKAEKNNFTDGFEGDTKFLLRVCELAHSKGSSSYNSFCFALLVSGYEYGRREGK
jgi:hypothetical protein